MCGGEHAATRVSGPHAPRCPTSARPLSWLRLPTKGSRWDWRSPSHPFQKLQIFTDEHFFFNLKKTLRRESPCSHLGRKEAVSKPPGWTSLRWSQAGGGSGFLQAGGGGWPHHTAIMSGTPAPSLGDSSCARVQPQTAPRAWGPQNHAASLEMRAEHSSRGSWQLEVAQGHATRSRAKSRHGGTLTAWGAQTRSSARARLRQANPREPTPTALAQPLRAGRAFCAAPPHAHSGSRRRETHLQKRFTQALGQEAAHLARSPARAQSSATLPWLGRPRPAPSFSHLQPAALRPLAPGRRHSPAAAPRPAVCCVRSRALRGTHRACVRACVRMCVRVHAAERGSGACLLPIVLEQFT